MNEKKLTIQQYENPDFMLNYYKSNPETLLYVRPTENLLKDAHFMIKFFKILNLNMEYLESKNIIIFNNLINDYSIYKHVIYDKNFVQEFAKEFPYKNILEIIYYSLSYSENNNAIEKDYEEILKGISEEILVSQAEKLGYQFMIRLPQSYSDKIKLTKHAIKCDGFQSLSVINIEKLLSNKDLIFLAYAKDGQEELKKFLFEKLSPERKDYKLSNDGKLHTVTHYSKLHDVVQKALLKDEEIIKLLQSHEEEMIEEKE